MDTTSEAKTLLFAFLKECTLENTWKFRTQPGDGEAMVQRMRTELSRLRAKIRNVGRIPKKFKMKKVKIIQVPGKFDEITLMRTQTTGHQMAEEVISMLDELSIGEMHE